MSSHEQLVEMLAARPLEHADMIAFFAGDSFERVPFVAQLYAQGYAPLVAIVSGDRRYEYGSRPASELGPALVAKGVPQEALYLKEIGMNTKDEAQGFAELARERGLSRLILVSSRHHIARAFLTMLRVGGDGLHYIPAVAPVEHPELVAQEVERIATYQAKGDVASYEDGIEYLKRHELNV